MRWAVRMAVVLVGVGLIDALVVGLAPRPLPWAALTPALIPVLTAAFVIVPMIKARTVRAKPEARS